MGSEFQGKQINSFRDLHVWQRAIELVVECYRLSASFPDSERFGLSNQFRRSAVSVPSNIAEGH
ncbi:MAG TPA: four helix bundle protein, partial [Planctomycetaceae bacterium]|nr:four helix bundle protein [Planctomycetaceae bacterium]